MEAKRRRRANPRELAVEDLRLLRAYCGRLKAHCVNRSCELLAGGVDEDRRALASCLSHAATLDGLQKALTVAIDACGSEDDDD